MRLVKERLKKSLGHWHSLLTLVLLRILVDLICSRIFLSLMQVEDDFIPIVLDFS